MTIARPVGRSTRDEASGWPEYERCCQLLRECECKVYRLAVSGYVPQSPGVPDMIAFSRLRGHAYIQVKHGTARETKAQKEFRGWCELTGVTIITGGLESVRDWLAPATRPADVCSHCGEALHWGD